MTSTFLSDDIKRYAMVLPLVSCEHVLARGLTDALLSFIRDNTEFITEAELVYCLDQIQRLRQPLATGMDPMSNELQKVLDTFEKENQEWIQAQLDANKGPSSGTEPQE